MQNPGYWTWPVSLAVENGHLVPKLEDQSHSPCDVQELTSAPTNLATRSHSPPKSNTSSPTPPKLHSPSNPASNSGSKSPCPPPAHPTHPTNPLQRIRLPTPPPRLTSLTKPTQKARVPHPSRILRRVGRKPLAPQFSLNLPKTTSENPTHYPPLLLKYEPCDTSSCLRSVAYR
jgi:hypothetical protein